jgi:hypothetical protein
MNTTTVTAKTVKHEPEYMLSDEEIKSLVESAA